MGREGAVVAGHICLDIIPELPAVDLPAVLTPGAVVMAGAAALSTGGAVSNTGLGLHILGIPTRLMAKVADDPFGRIILSLVSAYDAALARNMIVAQGETSSYTIVLSPQGVDRAFIHCAGANDTFSADDVSYEQLESARLFHFGYPPVMRRLYADNGAELAALFQRAKATGVVTSLDMSLPDPNSESGRVNWQHVLARVLPYVDIFLPSFDEALYALRRDLFDTRAYDDRLVSELAAELLAYGARLVVLKMGERGLYVRTGDALPDLAGDGWRNRELWAPCFVPESLAGTTGAGDTTIAGFLAALLREQPVEVALRSAAGVGACNVEAKDALSGLRTWDATQARIADGWARAELAIDTPGWTWSASDQVWIGPHDARRA